MGLGSLLSIIVWVVWVVYLGMLVVQMVRARRIWWAVVTSVVLLYWIGWFVWKVDFGRSLFQLRGWLDWVGLGLYVTVMLATPLWMFVNWMRSRRRGSERDARA
jgi:hypothetical protein